MLSTKPNLNLVCTMMIKYSFCIKGSVLNKLCRAMVINLIPSAVFSQLDNHSDKKCDNLQC